MSHSYRSTPAAGSTLAMIVSGYAYSPIPGCENISWDGFERAVRKPTHLLSDNVQKAPGMPDLGQIKATVWYDPNDATHKAMRSRVLMTAAAQSAALDSFEVTYADGYGTNSKADVIGFISSFSHKSNDAETGTWEMDLTIEVTSASFTDGSPAE